MATKLADFTVKGLKSYRGHEGEELYQGTLYLNGTKLGFIGEGDWGGPSNFTPENKQAEKLVDEFVATQPAVTFEGTRMKYDLDLFIGDLFTQEEKRKQQAKLHKQLKRGDVCFTHDALKKDVAYQYFSAPKGVQGNDLVQWQERAKEHLKNNKNYKNVQVLA